MPHIYQFRRGNEVDLPALKPGEPAITLDTEKLVIGFPTGNAVVAGLGTKGEKGDAGLPPTVTIGTVTTGAPGSSALVSVRGTQEDVILDFVIPTGSDGNTGEAGPIGINWCGEWSNTTSYELLDAVYYNGSTFICVQANTNETPVNGSYWNYVAQKGSDGIGSGDMLKATYDPDNDGNISADIVIDGIVNKAYTATEKTKLANIEANATADMSASEILNAIKTVDGTGSGLDADTIDGLEPSSFATATHNHDTDYEPINSNIQSHISSNSNPHNVTSSQVGAISETPISITADVNAEITKTGFYITNAIGLTNAPNSTDIWGFNAVMEDTNNGTVIAMDRSGSTAVYTQRKTGGTWQGWNRLLLSAPSNLTGIINEKQGTDIASASTCNIASATGNLVNITGTTTITAFGTAQSGSERVLIFTGSLILTHNATSLILPTGANITTAAGDVAIMRSLGSGNWKCISYLRANGKPIGFPTASDVGAIATSLLTTQGDLLYRGASALDRLPIGTSGYYLKSQGSGANPIWAAVAGGLQTKAGSFTRLMSTASGNVSYTGVGFQPKLIFFFPAGATSTKSMVGIGWDDGSARKFLSITEGNAPAASLISGQAFHILYDDGSNVYESYAVVASMDSDGFTLTWTRKLSVSQTETIYYLALA